KPILPLRDGGDMLAYEQPFTALLDKEPRETPGGFRNRALVLEDRVAHSSEHPRVSINVKVGNLMIETDVPQLLGPDIVEPLRLGQNLTKLVRVLKLIGEESRHHAHVLIHHCAVQRFADLE